jgi:5-methylthioadenosine/S-adenosylhomocysteine deaminase
VISRGEKALGFPSIEKGATLKMKEKTLLLKDADYVVRDFETVARDSSVIIQGNRIVDIGKAEDMEKKYPPDEVCICRGQILLPGLIDAHTHCNETIMRGLGHNLKFHDWVDEVILPIGAAMEREDEELYYCLAQLTAMELAASGSTALIEHSVNFGKRHVLTMARALQDFGMRGAVAKGAEDFSALDRGHVGSLEKEVKETQAYIETWQREESELIQAWAGPSGIEGKTTGGCSGDLLRELKALATSYQTRFHVHAAGNLPEVENLRRQKGLAGSVAFLEKIGVLDERTSIAHCIWVGEEEQKTLANTGTQVCHCPSCNQICALGVLPLVKLLELGVTCAIGTDGTPQNDSLDMFREMRQAILLQKIHSMNPDVMRDLEVFRMATEYGAKVLGVEKLGKIQAGYLADVIAVRREGNLFLTPMYEPLDTLIYACSGGRDVAMTMVNGKILYKDGEFKTADREKVISKIEDAAGCLKRA